MLASNKIHQRRLNTLHSTKCGVCYFSSSTKAFLFVPVFFYGWCRWEITQRGKPSSLSPTLAHQHVSFNHLHIFIIHLPQVMNYSTWEQWKKTRRMPVPCLFLFLYYLSLSFPPPHLPLSSGSVSLSHPPLSLWHREDKNGKKSQPAISMHVLPSRCLNVKMTLPKLISNALKQTLIPVRVY